MGATRRGQHWECNRVRRSGRRGRVSLEVRMETYTAIMMTVGAVVVISLLFLMALLRAEARDRQEMSEIEGATDRSPASTQRPYRAAELERAPIGTLTLLLVYLLVLAGLWGTAFMTLLRRG